MYSGGSSTRPRKARLDKCIANAHQPVPGHGACVPAELNPVNDSWGSVNLDAVLFENSGKVIQLGFCLGNQMRVERGMGIEPVDMV